MGTALALDPMNLRPFQTLLDQALQWRRQPVAQIVADSALRLSICPSNCSHPLRGNCAVPFLKYGASACNRLDEAIVRMEGVLLAKRRAAIRANGTVKLRRALSRYV